MTANDNMHILAIKNLLERFRFNKSMTDADINTTIRDILWNVHKLVYSEENK